MYKQLFDQNLKNVKIMRKFGIDRWNWSEKAEKWVYVQIRKGKRFYRYKDAPPKEFDNFTLELQDLNRNLLMETDYDKQMRLYRRLILLSRRIQNMKSELK